MPLSVAAIFSVLLVMTGISKLRRPTDTARALAQMGLPAPRATTLSVAVLEMIIGLTALATGSEWALTAQAGLYALFLGWVATALLQGIPMASCGCLGRDDTPPYWGHVILDGLGVVASIGAAVAGPAIVPGGLAVVASIFVVILGAWLSWEVLGTGARAAGVVKQ